MIKNEAHVRIKIKQRLEEGGGKFPDYQLADAIDYLVAGTNEWYIYGSAGHG